MSAGFVLLLASHHARAEHYTLPFTPPSSFEEIYKVIYGRDLKGNPYDERDGNGVPKALPAYLEKAISGGWDLTQSVIGKFARVTGVPGRTGDPLGNIRSGMAKRTEEGGLRNDGYQFPASAEGRSTTCEEGLKTKLKWVWRPNGAGGIEEVELWFPHPYFEDKPACLWRSRELEIPSGGSAKEEDVRLNFFELNPPHSPGKCKEEPSPDGYGQTQPGFCDWLNKFTYDDCKNVSVEVDADGNFVRNVCEQWGRRYICTEEWVGESQKKNCVPCKGSECRCDMDDSIPGACPLRTTENNNNWHYRSYYREYHPFEDRDRVKTDRNTDIPRNSADIACYGFYQEHDFKTHEVEYRDKRCVIQLTEAQVSELEQSQKGKGEYGKNSRIPDPAPLVRNGKYDQAKDLWYQNLGGGMSFLNKTVFDKTYDNDLSRAILTEDRASYQASWPIGPIFPPGRPEAGESSQIRAFDDSVSNGRREQRTVTQWWQRFETSAHEFFTPPVVHLLLPATWAWSVDALNPLTVSSMGPAITLQGQSGTLLRKDPRMEPIDVELAASDSLLGVVAEYLQRSLLLHLEEEPLPLVVPMGSPVEFRARAQQWETCKRDPVCLEKNGHSAAHADAMIARALEYAEQIEDVRSLRAELADTLGLFLKSQQQIAVTIARWTKENLRHYRDFLAQRRERLKLQTQWKEIQRTYNEFHEKTNQPWPKNDRFTTPIYSLLDPWLPGRPGLQGGLPSCQETRIWPWDEAKGVPLLCIPRQQDLVFDLSLLRLPRSKTVAIPVLQPVQVRVDFPDPYQPGKPVPPALPPVPSIRGQFDALAPTVQSGGLLPPILPSPPMEFSIGTGTTLPGSTTGALILQAWQSLERAHALVDGMNRTYEEFWDSLRAFDPKWKEREDAKKPPVPEADRKYPPRCRQLDGSYRELQPLECCGWDQKNCVHTETDLLERFVRIGARPMVLLREDIASRVAPRPKNSGKGYTYHCDSSDWSCQGLLGEMRPRRDGWQVLTRTESAEEMKDLIQKLREDLLGLTINPDGQIKDGIPYTAGPQRLYPVYPVPPRIDLSPKTGPSSSSSSSSPKP